MRLIENPLRLFIWAIALEIFICPPIVELRAIAKRQSEEFDSLVSFSSTRFYIYLIIL